MMQKKMNLAILNTVDKIYILRELFCENHNNHFPQTINNKFEVRNLFLNGDSNVWNNLLYEGLHNYINDCKTFSLTEIVIEEEFLSQHRIKQAESIEEKLKKYMTGNLEGKMAVMKCLNDVVGFRLILENYEHNHEELTSFLKEQRPNIELKVQNSTKNGYVATHIYFHNQKNKCLPWELQIWCKNDRINNEKSHELYKQKHLDKYKGGQNI